MKYLLFAFCLFAFGCGSDDASVEQPATQNNTGSGGKGDDPGQVCDADCDLGGVDLGDLGADAGADMGDMQLDPNVIPADSDLLFDYLQAETYLALEGQSEIKRDPSSFHGNSKVYFNAPLVASFEAGNLVHPKDSAAVKVLFDDQDVMVGWAVAVKLSDEDSSSAWWWYENETTTVNDPIQAGVNGRCARCHGGGVDRIVTPYPFE